MRLLVIGGTVFLGRWVVIEALTRGHEVTVFHRGLHNPGLFPQAQELFGDRDGDFGALAGARFDAVIDTCGNRPAEVAATAAVVEFEHYGFVSSAAVYRDWPAQPIADETAPRHESDEERHGPLKAACERVLEEMLPEQALLVRPQPIVGPYEYTGRLTWWLERMARGGPVLAPGPAAAPVQLIDARDLAEFMLDMAEQRIAGAVNVAAPRGMFTWGRLLEACRDITDAGAELVWVDGERVAAALEDPWDQLPLWPIAGETTAGLYDVGAQAALGAGLQVRTLEATVEDAWITLREEGQTDYMPELRVTGLDERRETVLLTALG